MRTLDDVLESLSHQKPSPEAIPAIAELRRVAKGFAEQIAAVAIEVGMDRRCQSLAYTKLEECLMWAVKGVVLYKREDAFKVPLTSCEVPVTSGYVQMPLTIQEGAQVVVKNVAGLDHGSAGDEAPSRAELIKEFAAELLDTCQGYNDGEIERLVVRAARIADAILAEVKRGEEAEDAGGAESEG